MSLNSAEAKLRTLAAADTTMQSFFGSAPFRWFHIQMPQGYITKGSCIRVRRVSAVYTYAQEGITEIEQVRMQLDCLNEDQDAARNALNAVNNFIATVDLMSNAQFASPPTTPTQFPNYRLSERSGIEFQVERQIYVWSADWRIWNNLSLLS